jgi:hypothetical protein
MLCPNTAQIKINPKRPMSLLDLVMLSSQHLNESLEVSRFQDSFFDDHFPGTRPFSSSNRLRTYLKISTAEFNELTRSGIINRYTHVGGKHPFFLKHELDSHLSSLPRYKTDDYEASPNSEEGSSV